MLMPLYAWAEGDASMAIPHRQPNHPRSIRLARSQPVYSPTGPCIAIKNEARIRWRRQASNLKHCVLTVQRVGRFRLAQHQPEKAQSRAVVRELPAQAAHSTLRPFVEWAGSVNGMN
jgi:hypothetical protein